MSDDPLKRLFAAPPLKAFLFPPQSRYAGVDTATLTVTGRGSVVYLRRRFVAQPESHVAIKDHVVRQGERLDNIAAAELGDPELFWRLADANGALDPHELTDEAGRRLLVTLPAGIPGSGGSR